MDLFINADTDSDSFPNTLANADSVANATTDTAADAATRAIITIYSIDDFVSLRDSLL